MTTTGSKRRPKGDIKFAITLNEEQKLHKAQILQHPYNFIIGKPGSGKTLLACQIALDRLFKREVSRIILTRPTVSTEDNGFLPGALEDKLERWIAPIRDNMYQVYGHRAKLMKCEEDGDIQVMALTHYRGTTFTNAVIIIDEFQNLTSNQFKMVVGRLGKGSTMIFCGDNSQVDLKQPHDSATKYLNVIPHNGQYTYVAELHANHRHDAVEYIFNVLK